MLGLNRIVSSALVAVALLTATCTWGPSWARRFGLNVGDLPALTWQLEQERLRREVLQAEAKRLNAQRRRQSAVIDALLARRLTLAQAAASLRDSRVDEPPKVRRLGRRYFPDLSEDEWFCTLVIHAVEARLYHRPQEAQTWVARLEEELRQHRRRGTLRLPRAGKSPRVGASTPSSSIS
jgi:hypothetical protein